MSQSRQMKERRRRKNEEKREKRKRRREKRKNGRERNKRERRNKTETEGMSMIHRARKEQMLFLLCFILHTIVYYRRPLHVFDISGVVLHSDTVTITCLDYLLTHLPILRILFCNILTLPAPCYI